jgi:hypothetical protein
MRPFVSTVVIALLLGGSTCLAQVSTMGTTAMGIPSTPGAIVASPLTGPSPFSAVTLPGTPNTTLAPVPLALAIIRASHGIHFADGVDRDVSKQQLNDAIDLPGIGDDRHAWRRKYDWNTSIAFNKRHIDQRERDRNHRANPSARKFDTNRRMRLDRGRLIDQQRRVAALNP